MEKEKQESYSFKDMQSVVKEEFGEEGFVLKYHPDNRSTVVLAEIGDNRIELIQILTKSGKETLISKTSSGEITTEGGTKEEFDYLKADFERFSQIAYGFECSEEVVETPNKIRVSVDSDEVAKGYDEERKIENLLKIVAGHFWRGAPNKRDILVLIAESSKYDDNPQGTKNFWIRGMKEVVKKYGFKKWELMFTQCDDQTGYQRYYIVTTSEQEKEETKGL